MATLDAKKIIIPHFGHFYEAPVDTPWPTDTKTPLSPAWLAWGYLGPDGIGESITSSTEEGKAFQNNETVYTIDTGSSAEMTIPALETRAHIIETIHGTVVDKSDGSYEIDPTAPKPRRRFCAWLVDKRTGKVTLRMWEGETISLGGVNYVSTAAIILTPTIRVFGSIRVIDDNLATEAPEAPAA